MHGCVRAFVRSCVHACVYVAMHVCGNACIVYRVCEHVVNEDWCMLVVDEYVSSILCSRKSGESWLNLA